MVKKFKITDIIWDQDEDDDTKLPKEFEIDVEVDDYIDFRSPIDVGDWIGDAISDKYGYCHYGFNYEEVKNEN